MTLKPDDNSANIPQTRPAGVGSLLLRLALLSLAVAVTVVGIVAFVPDANDYAKATLLKHERLSTTPGRKIVLVGGSNLAYGIDGALIERETGCTSVNMGMNGYFGPRYMFSEVKSDLKPGDIVIVAFEWDNYAKSVDGDGNSLFGVAKANPAALGYMTPAQIQSAVVKLPYVAQTKVMRLMRSVWQGIDGAPTGPQLNEIESLKGFAPTGDLISHAGVKWNTDFEGGLNLTQLGLNPEIITLTKAFSAEMSKKGVKVMVSYTPTMRYYYDEHHSVMQTAHHELTTGKDAVSAPSAPETFVYDRSQFFDTIYHLRAETRGGRTQTLINDLRRTMGDAALCKTS